MAQVDCVGKSEIEILDKGDTVNDGPPMKKFKQVRLPFKPLDHKSQTKGTSPGGGKKRKLSDNESPSAKQIKTSASKPVKKPVPDECEPEVSSSSEADSNAQPGHKKGTRKINTLHSFFKPQTNHKDDQGEISSTIEYVDLTDNLSGSNDNKADEDVEDVESSMEVETEAENSEDKKENQDPSKDNNVKSGKTDVINLTDSVDDEDDKENTGGETSGLDQSFISDMSVCENALKTPAKGSDVQTITEPKGTDVVASTVEPASSTTPAAAIKQKSTPGSTSRKLSDSKKKEREDQRLKREQELEEKRLQKQREKDEKERIRSEKKKQKDLEKEEKEKARQEEKDKKEQERLEKLKQKEEEKKQKEKELEAKLEAKLEEKKKKDEEKRKKEEEKKQKEEEKKKEEEEELKKKEKKKESFTKFFIKKAPTLSPPKPSENTNKSIFMPFEVKPNMRLAPEYRIRLVDEQKKGLDESMNSQTTEENYLKSIKSSSFTARKSTKTWPRNLNEDKDVELLSHDKEVIEKVTHHAKYLGFHENTRPAYYGTWRKKSKKLSPRNPFKQDEGLFDYEVDSDDEWEEEEPGESVSSDEEDDPEDKDKEDKDEEEEDGDGWMVPHGYLSDGEGADDEEEVDNASKQDLQKIRQAAWESELKRQAKPLRMIAIGCCWAGDNTSKIAAQQLEMLLKFKAVSLKGESIPTSHSVVKAEAQSSTDKPDKNDEKTLKSSLKKSVPEEAIPDLIRLVHGNPTGIKNLVKEFRMFWKMKTDPSSVNTADTSVLETSAMEVDPKSDTQDEVTSTKSEINSPKTETGSTKGDEGKAGEGKSESADDFSISKRQLWMKIPVIAVREKRPDHKKVCWYVHSEVLKQYNMEEEISLPNTWKYVCIKEPKWAADKKPAEDAASVTATKPGPTSSVPSGRATPTIMQFAQPMSLSKIQAIGMQPVNKDPAGEGKESMDTAPRVTASVTPTQVESTLPSDQKTIKDMFAGHKKVKRDILSPTSTKLAEQKKVLCTKGSPRVALNKVNGKDQGSDNNNVIVIEENESVNIEVCNDLQTVQGSKTKKNTSQDKRKAAKKGVKVASEIKNVLAAGKNTGQACTGMLDPNAHVSKLHTPTTPKTSGYQVLNTMLSSPELMKTSPADKKVVPAENKGVSMDVDDDVIVLD